MANAIQNPESLDKQVHFINLTNTRTVEISPGFFRDWRGCLDGVCGSCCKVVTLDFLDGSERWEKFKRTYPHLVSDFTQRKRGNATFWSNLQKDNKDNYCTYLDKQTGLCTIHESNPLACSLPMMKFLDKVSTNKTILISTTYGRMWQFERVNGEKGGICRMTEYSQERTLSDIDKLVELKEVGEAIGLETKVLGRLIDKLVSILESGEVPKEKIVLELED